MSYKDRKMNEDKAIELAKDITRKIEGRDVFLKGTVPDGMLHTPELETFKLYSAFDVSASKQILEKFRKLSQDAWDAYVIANPGKDLENITEGLSKIRAALKDSFKDTILLQGGFKPGQTLIVSAPRKYGKSAFKHSDLLPKLIEQEIIKSIPVQDSEDINLKEIQKALKKSKREAPWKNKNKRNFQGYQGGK